MIRETLVMRNWRVGFALVVAFAGCTKPNPKSCIDGTCTTEAYPFCDIDGSFAGEPQTCIAVDCEPNAFAQCRDDDALSCNATGTDYDTKQCPLGCQDGVGCRVCAPNETVCANGAVQTCDAGGNVVSSEACALGCFEVEPRCRNIDPSNNLATFIDMAVSPPDLDLSQGGGIATSSGVVSDAAFHSISIPTFLMSAPPGGVSVRVLIANNVTLGNVSVVSGERDAPGPALAIVALGRLRVTGTLSLWYDSGTSGAYDFAGGVDDPTCRPGPGQEDFSSQYEQSAGSGGGGHASAGGHGGGINAQLNGGTGGLPSGAPTLIPLRGGCAGGGLSVNAQPADGRGPSGGGALQLVSNVSIEFDVNSIVNASGSMGSVEEGGPAAALGGGAGGGILVEAPIVSIGQGARLLVNGGPGGSGSNGVGVPSLSADIALGGQCAGTSALFQCTNGGNGATLSGAANDIGDLPPRSSGAGQTRQKGGAGGGGLGFIRINTITGDYAVSSAAIISGTSSKGTIRTR
jgi:hypothetical protein